VIPLNIRWKLTVWYGAVLAAVLALFGTTVYFMMRQELYGQVAAGLKMEMGEVHDEIARAKTVEELSVWLNRRFTRHPGFDIQVVTVAGEALLKSERIAQSGLPVPRSLPPEGRTVFRRFEDPEREPCYLATRQVPGPDGPLVLQVAGSVAGVDHELSELLAILVLAGPLALLGALGGGYMLARQALTPVDRMAAAAEKITANRLDRRLRTPNPRDELGRLAGTLNRMIERLERSFNEIRRFTADAAHELRTPLTVMRNAAEVALRAPRDPDHYRRVLEEMLEELDRLGRLADQLLFLCREDAGLSAPNRTPIRLDALARDAVEHLRVVAEEHGLDLILDASESVVVSGDDDQLRRLIFNLSDNALKYTPSGGTVRMRVARIGPEAQLEVTDTGIGIPPEHLSHVFGRFYRVDPARGPETSGTGLGLAICQSIAESHGGRIQLESQPGTGTSVRVMLPLAPTEVNGPASKAPKQTTSKNAQARDYSSGDLRP